MDAKPWWVVTPKNKYVPPPPPPRYYKSMDKSRGKVTDSARLQNKTGQNPQNSFDERTPPFELLLSLADNTEVPNKLVQFQYSAISRRGTDPISYTYI